MNKLKSKHFYIFASLLLLLSQACVEEFDTSDVIDYEPRLVIEGMLVKNAPGDTQQVVISKSVPYDSLLFSPVSNCNVSIVSSSQSYGLEEDADNEGYYLGVVPSEDIQVGDVFYLRVITEDGTIYESTEDQITPCPEIDTIYYEVTNNQESTDADESYGAQFYIDLKADDAYSSYYRYTVVETYELHADYVIYDYINEEGNFVSDLFGDYSKYYCYRTENIDELYPLTTQELTENTYIKYPLNFVDNTTQRLKYNYSILLNQYSLSKTVFEFWNTLKQNNQSSVDLYSTQPATVVGNIFNVNDDDEVVLGYFGASELSSKRLTIKGGLPIEFNIKSCSLTELTDVLPDIPLPLYLLGITLDDGSDGYGYNQSCFDCAYKKGNYDKPSFFE